MKQKTYLEELQEIKTVKDLLTFIRMRCLDTSEIEHINRICDILGNAPMCDLKEAANSDKNTFFMMVKHCWSIVQMIEFYNENCNPRYEQMTRYENQLEKLESSFKNLSADLDGTVTILNNVRTERNRLEIKAANQGQEITRQEEEILRLKARLYDLEHKEDNND